MEGLHFGVVILHNVKYRMIHRQKCSDEEWAADPSCKTLRSAAGTNRFLVAPGMHRSGRSSDGRFGFIVYSETAPVGQDHAFCSDDADDYCCSIISMVDQIMRDQWCLDDPSPTSKIRLILPGKCRYESCGAAVVLARVAQWIPGMKDYAGLAVSGTCHVGDTISLRKADHLEEKHSLLESCGWRDPLEIIGCGQWKSAKFNDFVVEATRRFGGCNHNLDKICDIIEKNASKSQLQIWSGNTVPSPTYGRMCR